MFIPSINKIFLKYLAWTWWRNHPLDTYNRAIKMPVSVRKRNQPQQKPPTKSTNKKTMNKTNHISWLIIALCKKNLSIAI